MRRPVPPPPTGPGTGTAERPDRRNGDHRSRPALHDVSLPRGTTSHTAPPGARAPGLPAVADGDDCAAAPGRPPTGHRAWEILAVVAHTSVRLLREGPTDGVVDDMLARLGAVTSAHRAQMLVRTGEGTRVRVRAEWCADGTAPTGLGALGDVDLSPGRLERWFLRGEPVSGPPADLAMPAATRDALRDLGVRSLASVPVLVDDDWWGTLALHDRTAPRVWTPPELDALRTAAGALGAAIARDRSAERFRLAAEVAPESVTICRAVRDPAGELVDLEITEANAGASAATGLPRDRLVGRRFGELFPPILHGTPLPADCARALTTERAVEREVVGVAGVPQAGLTLWYRVVPLGADALALTVRDVTEQRAKDRRIAESERRYRLLAESLPDVIVRFDRGCRIVYANPAVAVATGIPAERWSGRTARQMGLPPELCDGWEAQIRGAFADGNPSTRTNSYGTPQGRRRFQFFVTPERDEDGGISHVIGVARDVTEERLRADEEAAVARVSQAVAEALGPAQVFETVCREAAQLFASDGAAVTRFDDDLGRVVATHAATDAARLVARGVPPVDLAGPTAAAQVYRTGAPARTDAYPVNSSDAMATHLSRVFTAGIAAPIPVENRVWGAVSVVAAPGEELPPGAEERLGRFGRLAGLAITNAQRIEALRHEKDRMAGLVAAIQEGVAELAADGRVTVANERFCQMVGLPENAVLGCGAPYPWWPHDERERVGAILGRFQRGEDTHTTLEMTLLRSDGVRMPVMASVAAITPGRPEGGFAATFVDLTSIRHAERTELRLRDLATLIARGGAADDVLGAVARSTRDLFGTIAATVVRFEAGERGRLVGFDSDVPMGHLRAGAVVPLTDGHTATSRVLHTGRAARVSGYDPEGDVNQRALASAADGAVGVPIHVEGRLWGALVILTAGDPPPPDTEHRLARFAELVGIAVAQAEAHAELEMRATTDHLTNLPNHRSFYERLRGEVQRHRGAGHDLCLAVLDIDGFKGANDLHGHLEGDRMLGEFAAALAAQGRDGDLIARVGGDEFAWLMPGTSLEEATRVLERATSALAGTRIPPVGRLSVSAGLASLAQAHHDARNLTRLADGALYWAKAEGRNRVVAYDPERILEHTPEERAERILREQGLAALRALARAVDAKDPDTAEHSERVANLAGTLARNLGWSPDDAQRLREAALVHDVGKIGVPDAILFKPGPLTRGERLRVQGHAELGAEIASEVLDAEQVTWVRGHHERYDGAGYPDGLASAGIPEGARILALADAFDVMVSVRTYKAARTWDDALAEAGRCAGEQFDPRVVRALRRLWLAGVVAEPAVPPAAPRGG